jgi:hypothetical protein
MSKRFREFSRLYWQNVRPKPKPRLHPAMVERMWKRGQSGNPLGRKAFVEAVRETTEQPVELSAGAKRTRRWHERKQQDVMVVSGDFAQDIVAKFIRFGWLDEAKRSDKARGDRNSAHRTCEKGDRVGGDVGAALDVTCLGAPELPHRIPTPRGVYGALRQL